MPADLTRAAVLDALKSVATPNGGSNVVDAGVVSKAVLAKRYANAVE